MERWRAPAGITLEAELSEYRRILGTFSQIEVRRALERIKAAKPSREWPAPATILEAMREHIDRNRGVDTQPSAVQLSRLTAMSAAEFAAWHDKQLSAPRSKAWHAEQREAVMLNWPLARLAAEEGWIGVLADYSIEYGQPPDARDLDNLRRRQEEFEGVMDTMQSGPATRIASMIRLRHQRLRARVLKVSDVWP